MRLLIRYDRKGASRRSWALHAPSKPLLLANVLDRPHRHELNHV